MHSLGFLHEHTRADRDDYVKINWNCILNENKYKFKRYEFPTFGVPYDGKSVMHYLPKNTGHYRNGDCIGITSKVSNEIDLKSSLIKKQRKSPIGISISKKSMVSFEGFDIIMGP